MEANIIASQKGVWSQSLRLDRLGRVQTIRVERDRFLQPDRDGKAEDAARLTGLRPAFAITQEKCVI